MIDKNGWNDDMSAAPKDGTTVLTYTPAPAERLLDEGYGVNTAYWDSDWKWVVAAYPADCSVGIINAKPAHWMPVPPTPEGVE